MRKVQSLLHTLAPTRLADLGMVTKAFKKGWVSGVIDT